jgi:RNA polymerase sigma-70 factor (ECF subfamily)
MISLEQDCDIFEIWEEYKSALYRFILNRIPDEQEAKDLLQDVLLKSYQYCAKGKTVLYLKSWLYKITANTIIDHYKKAGKFQPIVSDMVSEEDGISVMGEASVYIRALLRLLPKEYALPLAMYDLENMSQKYIAQRLGLSLSNTKSRVQRGRTKLKERFLECCTVVFDDNGEMISFDIKPLCKDLQAEKMRLQNIF